MFALVLALSLSASCALQEWEFHHVSSKSNEVMLFSLDVKSRRIMDEAMCRGTPTNSAVFRLQPNVKTMKYVEKDEDENKVTKIQPCGLTPDVVHDTARCLVCGQANCNTTFELPCKRPQRSSIWDYALEVDITIQNGVITECFVICLDPGYYEDDIYQGGNGVSYLEVLLIIAGVMIVAIVSMLGIVLWYVLSHRTNKNKAILS